jgi:hypothetical protein
MERMAMRGAGGGRGEEGAFQVTITERKNAAGKAPVSIQSGRTADVLLVLHPLRSASMTPEVVSIDRLTSRRNPIRTESAEPNLSP